MNSFQHFGNISTDSKSPAFEFFRTDLKYAFILTEKFKNQQNIQLFGDFALETGFWKNSTGSMGN